MALANSRQANKRIRQSEKRRNANVAHRSMMRTFLKRTVKAIEDKDLVVAKASFQKLQPILDRYATKGLIHKNKVARHKRRLNMRIKALAM